MSKVSMTDAEMIDCLMHADLHFLEWCKGQSAAANEEDFRHLYRSIGHLGDKSRTEREKRNQLLIILIGSLHSGELGLSLRNVLANFLVAIYNDEDETLARKVLGLPPVGRGRQLTDESVRWDRASGIYEHLIMLGHSDAHAVHETWQEYHFGKVAAVEQATQGKRSRGELPETRYEAQIRAIRSRLNNGYGRTPSKPGRKRNVKPK